jgi:hypothetical protein
LSFRFLVQRTFPHPFRRSQRSSIRFGAYPAR